MRPNVALGKSIEVEEDIAMIISHAKEKIINCEV